MNKSLFAVSFTIAVTGAVVISGNVTADNHASMISLARSAAPSMISDDATVMYRGTVLAEGSNGWVCLPETLPDDGAPMCNDSTWMAMMQAVGSKAPFSADKIGVSYMLQGDAGTSNADPYHAHPMEADDFIQEGPHLMMILPSDTITGITNDPFAGGSYVMWRDTPYAHIMIPVGERPDSNK